MGDRRALLDELYQGMPDKPDESLEVSHHFGAGTYVRRSLVPAGAMIRLHVHQYDHLTIVAGGRGMLATDEETREVVAGDVVEVKAGLRHVYRALEDTVFLCVHGTTEEEAKKLYGGKPS